MTQSADLNKVEDLWDVAEQVIKNVEKLCDTNM